MVLEPLARMAKQMFDVARLDDCANCTKHSSLRVTSMSAQQPAGFARGGEIPRRVEGADWIGNLHRVKITVQTRKGENPRC